MRIGRNGLLLLLAALLLLSGCGGAAREPVSRTWMAMDTVMQATVYDGDEELLDQAEELVQELEEELSVTNPDSALSQLNRTGSAQLSPQAADLLEQALELCRLTDGALDVSIYPVLRSWGFTTGEYRVPEAEELAELLTRVDYHQVLLSQDGVAQLPQGMELDLGAVAKGYTGDLLLEAFRQAGVTSALLSLGGNVQALGSKPDGSDWTVAIQDPEGEGYLGYLSVSDQAVVTSGGYERYFQGEDGTIYWHILDPETGCPARSGLISVTVVGSSGLFCDGMSTALFVLGEEEAVSLWRSLGEFELILVTEDGRLLLTQGLADRFQAEAGTGYELEVIKDA